MKNGKFQNGRRSFGSKSIATLLAVVLMMTCAVGGTIAWLTDTTDEVENAFTVGNIDITLTETKTDFKMIPGWTIEKDPVVTVLKGSEDCWVFVKVAEENELKKYIDYTIDPNNWKKLDGKEGVWYAKYENRDDVDIGIKVLLNNQVTVKNTVTKEMMDALLKKDAQGNVILDQDGNPTYDTEKLPKLNFTAYAVQLYESNGVEFNPADAWAQVAATTP